MQNFLSFKKKDMSKISLIMNLLNQSANNKRSKFYEDYFKTKDGEYGKGDRFLGLTVYQIRKIAKIYFNDLNFKELKIFLKSKIHEYRLFALIIIRLRYEKGNYRLRRKIVDFYLKNTKQINNWDLVDLSCYYILGHWLLENKKDILYKLAESKNLWERRISIISTLAFIRCNKFQDTFKISKILLNDNHYLIHKAVGWMLREIGKRDKKSLKKFLDKNYRKMPKLMLRYTVEKFDPKERYRYLS